MFFIRVENLYRLIQSPVKFSNKKLLTALFFFQPKPEKRNWQPLGKRRAKKQASMWLNTLQEKKKKKQQLPSCMVLQVKQVGSKSYFCMVPRI